MNTEFIFQNIPSTFLRAVYRIAGKRLLIPYYHVVSKETLPHVKNLFKYKNPEEFVADLEWLTANYQPVSLEEVICVIESDQELPDNSFLLTFDDGFSEIDTLIRPILDRMNIPAVFFVSSDFIDNRSMCYLHKASLIVERIKTSLSKVEEDELATLLQTQRSDHQIIIEATLAVKYAERDILDNIARILEIDFNDFLKKRRPYLSTDQVNSLLRRGYAIGSHSIDHPLYRDLDIDEQVRQTLESVKWLCKRFSLPYRVFAFPHSDIGVGRSYFDKISTDGQVQLSFGTAGMIRDSVPFNFQRFSMEKPMMPADKLIAFYWGRMIKHQLSWKGTINRHVSNSS